MNDQMKLLAEEFFTTESEGLQNPTQKTRGD